MNQAENFIHFVGAGPGDPELITVKGRRLLEAAELVVYTGSLVPKALLAGLSAKIHDSAGLTLDQVIELLAAAWRRGRAVVRLHTGDPSIYGAIGEQMARLAELGIPWRVVPGVSSATAAAAALSAELTLPEISQTVIITRRAGRTPVPEGEKLTKLAAHQATMLILLSAGMVAEVASELIAGGYPPQTPAAVVEKASWPEERIVRGSLADIAARANEAGISKTAIILVGRVLAASPPPVLSKLYDPAFSHGYRSGQSSVKVIGPGTGVGVVQPGSGSFSAGILPASEAPAAAGEPAAAGLHDPRPSVTFAEPRPEGKKG